jgi:septum formation protein
VVLASSSPTRRRLLATIIPDFEVIPASIEETEADCSTAVGMATELARRKCLAVARMRPDALVIAADTLVACQGGILGKPRDVADARRILALLQEAEHDVVTAVHVAAPDGRHRSTCVATTVRMRKLPEAKIEELAALPGTLERAGAYALQHDDPNVEELRGSPTAVMGLPLEELSKILDDLDVPRQGESE